MNEVSLKAKAFPSKNKINFEFGRTQAGMWISSKGKAARQLKLKEGNKVEILIRKLD